MTKPDDAEQAIAAMRAEVAKMRGEVEQLALELLELVRLLRARRR